MKSARIIPIALTITLALIAAGCGGGGGDDSPPRSNSYLPMQIGNSWDYQMTLAPGLVPAQAQPNQLFDYHETITGIATLDENNYFLFRSVRDETEEYPQRVWQQIRRETSEAIFARVGGESAYDLPVLMLPPREGLTWPDPLFPEVELLVAAVGEQITVPAGTFTCVRVEQTYEFQPEFDESVATQVDASQPVTGTPVVETTKSWFARGVGLVKEETWTDDVQLDMLELTDHVVQ